LATVGQHHTGAATIINEITAAIGKGLACAATVVTLGSCQMAETDTEKLIYNQGFAVIADCAATRCATLNFDSKGLPVYSALGTMTHLRAVMISYTDFSGLGARAPLTGLQEIHIGGTPVTDLSPLVNFANLRMLHIQGVDTDDYLVLRQLTRLEELAIGYTPIPNVVFVRDMPNLKRLDLSYARITDLSALRNHPSIETLNVDGLYGVDLSPLVSMPALREVALPYNEAMTGAVAQALREKGVVVSSIPVVVVC
jgi:internalin A